MADWNNGPSDGGWGTAGGSQYASASLNNGSEENWGGRNDLGDGTDALCNGCGQGDHGVDRCPNGITADRFTENDQGDDKCFGCGEVGHRRAECPTAGEIECRYCKKAGHMIKDCPEKGPMICNNCGEAGHLQKSCDKARKINRDDVADVSPEEAWEKIKEAAADRDVDDAKEAVQEYVKALDGTPTYKDIQLGLIEANINLWFIPRERDLLGAFTNMDLQGNVDKKYTVSYRFSENPSRPREREGWPETRDVILSRLDDAGETVNSGKTRCFNCGEFGHGSKACPEPPREWAEEALLCPNCNGEGHRLRDCPQPRVDKFACKNCGKSGHKAAECEEPPNLDNMTCHKCGENGHMSRDCPQGGGGRACHNCGQEGHMSKECDQPRNMDLVTCRNCEKTGHMSRDCPEPKDWSKVQCSNCQQYGHTKVRCKEPTVEEPSFENGDGGYDAVNDQSTENNWDSGAATAVDDGFGDGQDYNSGGW